MSETNADEIQATAQNATEENRASPVNEREGEEVANPAADQESAPQPEPTTDEKMKESEEKVDKVDSTGDQEESKEESNLSQQNLEKPIAEANNLPVGTNDHLADSDQKIKESVNDSAVGDDTATGKASNPGEPVIDKQKTVKNDEDAAGPDRVTVSDAKLDSNEAEKQGEATDADPANIESSEQADVVAVNVESNDDISGEKDGDVQVRKQDREENVTPVSTAQETHESGDVSTGDSKEPGQNLEEPGQNPKPRQNPEEPVQNPKDVMIPSAGPQNESPTIPNQSAPIPEAPPLLPVTQRSAVESATSGQAFQDSEQALPLSLSWTFGFNRHIGCLNLSDTARNLVMYASSHVAVLLDIDNNVQKLLLGHANAITCIDCSADKRWLVTADKGDSSSVIVWDSYTGIPVQSIFDTPGGKGNVAVAMSSNAKYIITVSAGSPQIVSVWDWTTSGDFPLCSIDLPVDFGTQTKVTFCHNDDEQFATNSDSQVMFFSWATGELEYHAPYLSDDVFNRTVGSFSQTMYQLDGIRALTGTSQGNVVVWEPERPNAKSGAETPAIMKRALKLVRLQDRAITTLSFTNGYIITGDIMGAIKFYDSNLDLYSWHSNSKQIGPITSISFKYDPDFNTELLADSNIYPADATIAGNPFIVRDFLISTKHAEIFSVHADGSGVDTILREHDAAVHAIAVSSTKPWICIGSYAGLVKIWDYETKQCIVTRVFEKGYNIQCLAFDKIGLQVAIGMTNGSVHVLDAISLTEVIEKPFRYARDAITHIAFSHDSQYLATADADMATTVFIADLTEGWKYLGRYRAHYKTIKDLSFGVALDTNLPRLLTLGEDRSLVEYDLMNSSKDDLRLVSIDRIEQNAVPTCLAWYPDVAKESFLVMVNSQYKYKLFNTTTKMCRKTLLAPTYGSCVQKILPLSPDETDKSNKTRLLSYITNHKVGLQILPLDGNPHKSVAVMGHPSGISHLASSYDGKYLFTAGGKDSCVHMWSVSTTALEAAASLGGEGLTPFYGLLEGGRDGELFAELENYFYFAQLRNQGLDTTEPREVSTVIPLEQIPFVMRALGFYPSEQEIEDMLNEVKFSEYVETGQYVSEINLGDFIKLYVNHRPAFGLTPDEIEKAFDILGTKAQRGESWIDKDKLFNILQRRGEHMTEHEVTRCLGTLLGVSSEGGSTEHDLNSDNDILSKYVDDILPDQVSALMFAEEILGLPLSET